MKRLISNSYMFYFIQHLVSVIQWWFGTQNRGAKNNENMMRAISSINLSTESQEVYMQDQKSVFGTAQYTQPNTNISQFFHLNQKKKCHLSITYTLLWPVFQRKIKQPKVEGTRMLFWGKLFFSHFPKEVVEWEVRVSDFRQTYFGIHIL